MFCDVSLPVPLDQPFTYALPLSLVNRVKPGARVVVPFGTRKLTGVVLAVHRQTPDRQARAVEKLIDEEPIFDTTLLRLAHWVASYYCAPLGEVLRSMAPTSAETSRSKVYTLTDTGRDYVRQSLFGEEDPSPQARLLRMLEVRPLSASYLKTKVEDAPRLLKALEQKGFIGVEEDVSAKDPMRAPAEQLRVRFAKRAEGLKLPKVEQIGRAHV